MSSREISNAKSGVSGPDKSVARSEYGFRDPVVKNVVDKFVSRSNTGFEKYGRTLDSERRGRHKDLAGYLNDIQEELMDAVLYIQAAREELEDREGKIPECCDENNPCTCGAFHGAVPPDEKV